MPCNENVPQNEQVSLNLALKSLELVIKDLIVQTGVEISLKAASILIDMLLRLSWNF